MLSGIVGRWRCWRRWRRPTRTVGHNGRNRNVVRRVAVRMMVHRLIVRIISLHVRWGPQRTHRIASRWQWRSQHVYFWDPIRLHFALAIPKSGHSTVVVPLVLLRQLNESWHLMRSLAGLSSWSWRSWLVWLVVALTLSFISSVYHGPNNILRFVVIFLLFGRLVLPFWRSSGPRCSRCSFACSRITIDFHFPQRNDQWPMASLPSHALPIIMIQLDFTSTQHYQLIAQH